MASVDSSAYGSFIIPGLIFILLGLVLVAIPFLGRLVPSIEKLPPIIIWVYRSGDFYFVTSPILLILSIASVLLYLLRSRS